MHDKQVRRRRAVLALLVCASLILLTAYFGGSASNPLHSVQRGIAEVLSPVQSGASKVLSPVRDVAGWVSDTINAKSQNGKLKAENARLLQRVAQLQYEEIENRHLSKLVHLDQSDNIDAYSPVTANVIAQDPSLWYEQIEVDKGADDGVRLFDPVIGDSGLVGDVTTVGPSYAIVTELTGDKFAVGAEVEDAQGDTGVLQPAVGNPSSLLLQDLPAHTTDITANAEVVTSGFADKTNLKIHSLYPPGIPIGYVSNANADTLINDQQVTVTPYVDLRHLSVVQILTRPNTTTVSASVTAP